MRAVVIALLMLFAVAQAAAAPDGAPCPSAPRPRLRVGMTAVVAPGIDALNLRALPARETGIQGQLRAGGTLTVIGGASCNGGYTWWRVELPNGARGWIAEGTWEGYWVIPVDQPTLDPVTWSCGVGRWSRRCISP